MLPFSRSGCIERLALRDVPQGVKGMGDGGG